MSILLFVSGMNAGRIERSGKRYGYGSGYDYADDNGSGGLTHHASGDKSMVFTYCFSNVESINVGISCGNNVTIPSGSTPTLGYYT